MKITPILPPKNEADVKPALDKMLLAARALKVNLNPEGFVQAWLSDNTRVVVAYDEDKPVGFAIMVCGRRYFDERFTASILMAQGPARVQLLEFLLDMARILGAEALFYEHEDGDTLGGSAANMRVVEVR